MSKDYQVEISTTARFYVSGEISKNVKVLWVVFHGYGMLAKEFITKFDTITDENTIVVAPEGMHRFYKRGTRNEISANWMTSDLRESDIQNNIDYLNIVLSQLIDKGLPAEVKLGVLGFSQGGPTAFRWASQLDRSVQMLIAWGTDLPIDVIDNIKLLRKINESNIKLIIGSDDEYIDSDNVDDLIIDYSDKGVEFDFHTFNGGHEIDVDSIRYFQARMMHDGLEF
jgi:predicted esterase